MPVVLVLKTFKVIAFFRQLLRKRRQFLLAVLCGAQTEVLLVCEFALLKQFLGHNEYPIDFLLQVLHSVNIWFTCMPIMDQMT